MKFFFGRSLIILATFGVLSFSSCSKSKENDEKASNSSVPKIANSTRYSNGKIDESISPQYDNLGRVIKCTYEDESYATIEYSASSVTIKSYDDKGLNSTEIGQLNSKGLVVSASGTEDDGYLYHSTYEYDNNDYLKVSVEGEESATYKDTYTVIDWNAAIITEEHTTTTKSLTLGHINKPFFSNNGFRNYIPQGVLKSASTSSSTSNYQFFTDKVNTIGNENYGISFKGKQNINPTKNITFSSGSTEENYSYEYDNKGRITKQIWDNGACYCVYTYVE